MLCLQIGGGGICAGAMRRRQNSNLFQNHSNFFELPGGLKVCWGRQLLDYSNANICTKTINFPVTFTSTPRVFVTLNKGHDSNELRWVGYIAQGSVSTKSVIIAASDAGGGFSSSIRAWADWMAIGY